jgi:opacity protein-like surface antigen
MKTKNFFLLTILFYCQLNLIAQNTRLRDDNQIGWYNYFGTFKLNEKFGIHTEYQLRRDNLITDKQQELLRLGLNYQVNPNIQFRLGYAWIETYAYGDIPINSLGRNFTEHRSFQMITLLDKIAIVDISHRFMLEQRWVGRYSGANASSEDGFLGLNRMRYMVRAQVPLKGKKITDKIPYFAAYNEIFIGFGKNVNENVFDQNRIGLLLGYQFNKSLRIEAGYLNQILQLGREINGQNVFQYNNGVIINTNFTFDLSKKTN